MSYPVITWIQIVIFSVCTPYCLAVIVIFLTKIKEPSIRERFPYLVLVTGTGTLSLFHSSLFDNRNDRHTSMHCICVH